MDFEIRPPAKRTVQLLNRQPIRPIAESRTLPKEAVAELTMSRFKNDRLNRTVVTVGLALLIVFQLTAAALLPSIVNPDRFYSLTDQTKSIVGSTNEELSKKLSFDAEKQLYQYNKEAAPAGDPGSPEAALAAAQQSQKTGGGANNYTVDLSVDPEKGITIRDATDKSGSLAISMIPNFDMRGGKQKDGRIIYPLIGKSGHVVYSVKANGLKEDIVIDKPQGDNLEFSYQLKIPASLEARLLDNGGIGIYSADTALFGNISFGSDQDREKVENARKNSQKTNLVFAIPAPTIVQTGEGSDEVKSHFELKRDQLTVKAEGLSKAGYPLSIDPSVAVTSASDLQKGNLEGDGIEFDTTNSQIKRASLTGGTAPVQSQGATFTTGRFSHTTVAYNGYLYVIGGCTSQSLGECNNALTDVRYGQIDGNGDITSWSAATNQLPLARAGHSSFVYNGYVYVLAGANNSATCQNTVYYSKITSNGDLGSWTLESDTVLNAGKTSTMAVAYNGYAYIMGGNCGSSYNPFVEFAPLNADGSTGAWHYTHNSIDDNTTAVSGLPNSTSGAAIAIYNGYVYVMGGSNTSSGPGRLNTVVYAPLNANGTIGTWITNATSLPSVSYGVTGMAAGGYLYIFGGSQSGVALGGLTGNSYYAQINANGSVGSWHTNANFGAARARSSSASWNGYLYVTGGYTGSTTQNTERFKIDSAGVTAVSINSTAVPTARQQTNSVAYNGYLYVVAGWAGMNGTVYYAPLNADGSIGTWNTTASLVTNVYDHSVVAYNGYLYVMGGCTAADGTCAARTNVVQYAQINTNGTLNAWASATAGLPEQRSLHASVAYNGYLYVFGGCWGTGTSCAGAASTHVRYGTIGSNGDVTAWAGTSSFTNDRINLAAAVANGRVYITAGSSLAVSGEIQSTLICTGQNNGVAGCGATAGTVGTWTTTGMTATPVNTFDSGLEFYNGYLYIVGGFNLNNSTYLTSIYYARVNNDGTVGSWQTTTSLNTPRSQHGTAIYNGILYLSAGNNGSSLASTEYLRINNGGPGTTSSWTTSANNLPATRESAAAVVNNGYIYILGGSDNTNLVMYAAINADGTLGAWTSTNSFSTARTGLAAAVYNGYVYIHGGINGSTILADTQYAPINANGSLGAWASAGNSLNTARFVHSGAVYNGYLYALGGCSNWSVLTCNTMQSTVEYAQINSDGTIGAWNTTASFSTARAFQTSVVVNGYIYIIGGCGVYNVGACTAANYLNDVQYAPINSNGTVGSWNTTTGIGAGRYVHSSVVSNGYVYVIGGVTAAGQVADVLAASIGSNGALGAWSLASTLPANRFYQSSVANNGYIYAIGGHSGGVALSDTLIAGQQAIPRRGAYSWTTDLTGDAVATKLLWKGTEACSTSFSYKNAPYSTSAFGSSTSAPETNSNSLLTLTASENRYRWLRFTLDDSCNSIFPDSLSPTSTLTDFELWFRPATAAPSNGGSKRLRGGKTFNSVCSLSTTNNQCSLDAQPQ